MSFPALNLLSLCFRATAPIRRLPHYHGPHLSAFFRNLLRAACPDRPGIAESIMVQPAETGVTGFEPGEPVHLGLVCPAVSFRAIAGALSSIGSMPAAAGHFQPATLQLEGIFCRISGRWLQGEEEPIPLEWSHVEAEAEALASLETFTLKLLSPMRLTRPEGAKKKGHRYCDAGFFFNPAVKDPLGAITARMRIPDMPDCPAETDGIRITGGAASWLDIPYGTSISKTVGGMVGSLRFSGRPSPPLARSLVMGQYLGAGKNGAFGLGFYSIPELDHCRSIAPLTRGISLLQRGASLDALTAAAVDFTSGAPGPDSMTPEDILRAGAPLLQRISEDTLVGGFSFGGFKTFLVPKGSGGFRELKVQNCSERLLARSLSSSLSPAVDRLLSDSSYAYRRGLNRKAAASRLAALMKEGWESGIKADVAAFFDSVDTEALCDLFDGYFPFEPMGRFIRDFLKHAAEAGVKGLPQGWPLSPLLSNLYLDRFDRMVEEAGFRLVRFADDFVMLGRGEGAGEAAREAASVLLARLGLSLKQEKTEHVSKGNSIKFLGLAVSAGDVSDPAPDETHEEELWAPMFRPHWREGRPVYISSLCQGAYSSGACLVINSGAEALTQIPWNSISRIVIAGRARISGGALYRAVREEIPVTYIDITGRTRGHLRPEAAPRATERELQLQTAEDSVFCLDFSRVIISAKINNSFVLLRRNSINEPGLKELAEKAEQAESIDSARGYEGAAARLYWQHFATLVQPFSFPGRSYHPPEGPINVMLSFGYTLLYNRISSALADNALDPRTGFFHQGRGTHNALASDLQEELRHVVDRVVLALVHRREITPVDFTESKVRGIDVSRLSGEGFRKFIHRYESVMASPFTREGAKTCFNEYLDEMAAALRRSLKLKIPYVPLRIR